MNVTIERYIIPFVVADIRIFHWNFTWTFLSNTCDMYRVIDEHTNLVYQDGFKDLSTAIDYCRYNEFILSDAE